MSPVAGTRIIVASIPSGLPLALSEVARSCSAYLRKEGDVVCSEPGSLLTAAQVDTVVFDKVSDKASVSLRISRSSVFVYALFLDAE